MREQDLSDDFLELVRSVVALRPRRVIDHILEHGFVTTEELKERYGYDHPPRAARDVREKGVPLETVRVTGSNGRKIGAYKFGDPDKARRNQLAGRQTFSKEFKRRLVAEHQHRCAICDAAHEERYLQVDHRIPYEVAGEGDSPRDGVVSYMPLCGADNRAKSWSCERCKNWNEDRDPSICGSCYWAHSESYEHIAMVPQRRIDIVWHGEEIADFYAIQRRAAEQSLSVAEYVKRIMRRNG